MVNNARKYGRFLFVLSLCAAVLLGCQNQNSQSTEPSTYVYTPIIGDTFGINLAEEELPPVASSLLLTEALAVEPWDSNRCTITGNCKYGEIEEGIYGFSGYSLGYADKTNLDDWVVVCPYPDCKHAMESSGCPANIDGSFVIKDGRIYYSAVATQYSSLWMETMDEGYFLASLALDGSDTKVEHEFDSTGLVLSNGGGQSMHISAGYAILCRSVLNSDGLYDTQIIIVDEKGEHLIHSGTSDYVSAGGLSWASEHNTFGDRMFTCGILDPTWQLPFILTEDYTIEQVDLTGLPEEGAYLSDNIYRCFRSNDGYYDVNLETREETKLEEAQLENSHAFVVLPNCILESTLMGYTSVSTRDTATPHTMKLFDGQRWWDVELPEELQSVGPNKYLDVETVTSDRILLCLRDNNKRNDQGRVLYQIFLGTDRPVMEYAGTVEYQELPESW